MLVMTRMRRSPYRSTLASQPWPAGAGSPRLGNPSSACRAQPTWRSIGRHRDARTCRRQGLPGSPWRWHSVCCSCRRAWRTGFRMAGHRQAGGLETSDDPGQGRTPARDHPAGSGTSGRRPCPGTSRWTRPVRSRLAEAREGAVARLSAPCYRAPVTLSDTGGQGERAHCRRSARIGSTRRSSAAAGRSG